MTTHSTLSETYLQDDATEETIDDVMAARDATRLAEVFSATQIAAIAGNAACGEWCEVARADLASDAQTALEALTAQDAADLLAALDLGDTMTDPDDDELPADVQRAKREKRAALRAKVATLYTALAAVRS